MRCSIANNVALHWREDGDLDGVPVVFANSLGTDLRLWDDVLDRLPDGFRFIRYDKSGHGLSQLADRPAKIDGHIADIEALIDARARGPVIFVGLSIGGLIGQGLAAKRPDLIRALVLSNSAAQMGTPEMWQNRIAQIEQGGIELLADPILDRWFGAAFRHSTTARLWRAMLTRTPKEGYIAACHALADADVTQSTKTLKLPVLAISGSEDTACLPQKTRQTADMIDGARFEMIDGAGHLPCVEKPAQFAAILGQFLLEQIDE